MPALRTALFFLGWLGWTCIMGIIAVPGIVAPPMVWFCARIWATGTLMWLRLTCGITTVIEGLEHVKDARIIASKHQSAWDTLVLWAILKNPVFVLKRELYWIPVFGWYLWRTGQIGIDRSNPKGAIERITEEMNGDKKGRALIIFPEGTRLPPGAHKPFRPGIGKIATALNQPVVPVALNAGYFWPKRPILKHPGRAIIRFLPPVAPPVADGITAWVAALQASIDAECEKLKPSAG